MTKIDQFESVFKGADKTVYIYEPTDIRIALVVTDLDDHHAKLFGDRVRSFLEVLNKGDTVRWRDVSRDECGSIGELLATIEAERPDLICTYRNLHSRRWKWPYSLGEHLDLLTQATTIPVLVVPRPDKDQPFESALENTDSVMAITDRLTGDHRLVNYAVRFTQPAGTLYLTHIEDQATLDRYMDVISKIPFIDTDTAQEEILKQLLKEPGDYIRSCCEALEAEGLPLKVEKVVTLGHHLAAYERLIQERKVDLLVLNTKDEDQLAMHGLAYPLAVELRHIPLLML